MLKTQTKGNESIYSSEVALYSPAMAGELKAQNQHSPLWKTDIEFNPTVTPGQRSGTKLLPTSPSDIRVLWLLSSKYLLQPLNRVKVSTSAGQASMRSHHFLWLHSFHAFCPSVEFSTGLGPVVSLSWNFFKVPLKTKHCCSNLVV